MLELIIYLSLCGINILNMNTCTRSGVLAAIYTRILENPNQQLDRYFNSFKELAASRPLSELITVREAAAQASDVAEADGQVNEVVHSDPAEQTPKSVVKFYERCLIACASYPEYWIRYVLCMEAVGNMDLADNALSRSTQVFVKRQPEIHLFASRFKEQNGDIPGARAAYQLVHSEISPGFLEAIIKHANLERRLGKLEDAFSLYEQDIAIEKAKEHSQTLPILYAQYSRFSYLVSTNAEKAREILIGALDQVQLSKPFLETLIHFETILPPPKQIDYLESLVEKFIVPISDGSAADREDLSSIFLEFLSLFGDAQSIKKAEDRHAKLFLPNIPMSNLRKRHAEDFMSSAKTKLAKSYSSDPSSGQSLVSAYPNAQNQWAAGYAAQPQTWPPTTQAQTWTPGYGQQAAYGAYASYGSSYTTSQVPTTAPHSAAYGAYPSAYPVQAFPQQSYAQPAAAPTLTPAQQPVAAVTQTTYYGTYS